MIMFLLGMISGIVLMIIFAHINMIIDKRFDKRQLERQISILKDTLRTERDEHFRTCVERDEALMKLNEKKEES